jgi:PAS domain S-box-containing protein
MDTTLAASSSSRSTRAAAHLLARPRTSLAAKVSLLIGLASVSLAILFVVSGTSFIRDNELKRHLSHIGELLTTVQSTVQIASFTNDKTLATEVARGLMTNRSIAAVRITSGDQILAEIKKNTSGDGGAPHLVRKEVSSPFDERTLVGEIVLTADSNFILAQATQYSSIFAALLLLEVIAVTVVVVLVMLRTVVRPIMLVAAELQRIEGRAGAFLSTPKGHEENEIGRLAQAFNRMLDSMTSLLDKEHGMREEVARSEMRFRTLAENSPDIIARYDTQCRRIYINPAMQAQFGLPIERILGRTPLEIAALPEAQVYVERMQGVLKTGLESRMEIRYYDVQGGVRGGDMRLVPEFGLDGAVASVLVVTRDITERKRMEEALREREQRYRGIFDNVLDMLYLLEVTPDGRFRNLEINPAFEKASGIPSAELVGKFIEETVPEETANIVIVQYRRCIEAGTAIDEEVSLDMPSGLRHYHSTLIPVRDDSGRIHRIVGISRDITERKRMEYDLKESQHLLRQLAARNETAREDERKYLTREIHDELGQHLLALRLGVSVVDLQFGATNASLHEKTQRLIEMVDTTIKVVRNVVASLRPTVLDMGIVSALEWLAGEYSERTGVQCELHLSEEEILLDEACSTAIFRIVQESLTNIVRHAHANKVEITLERNEPNYLLEVRDNGVGFDPVLRKEKSFGLVSIRERALMLGGEVEISSAPGRSTVIRVHIPIHNVVTNALSES